MMAAIYFKRAFLVTLLLIFLQGGKAVASGLISHVIERGAATFSQLPTLRHYTLPHSYRPTADFATDVTKELQAVSQSLTRLNLQNKPLLFADSKKVFNPTTARRFIKHLSPALQIIDLSHNRLPADALPVFSELLVCPSFDFLDVRINNGAESMEALHLLSQLLTTRGVAQDEAPPILAKVIWAYRESLESLKGTGCMKPRYYDAHQRYYSLFQEDGEPWELPD